MNPIKKKLEVIIILALINLSTICSGYSTADFDEGIIKDPLSVQEIGKIVDFHLYISGEVHGVRGISISELLQEYLPNYEIEHFETYNYLGTIGSQNKFTKMYDSFLKRLFLEKGAHFSVVLKKVAHS